MEHKKDLNNCPDCGSDYVWVGKYKEKYHVKCDDCNACTGECDSIKEAIYNWNEGILLRSFLFKCQKCGSSKQYIAHANGKHEVACGECSSATNLCSTIAEAIHLWNNGKVDSKIKKNFELLKNGII